MKKINELQQDRLVKAMFAALIGIGSVGFVGSSALAQDTDDEEDMNTEVIEEVEDVTEDRITVTGSRIERAGLDTFYPAVSVDAQLFEDRSFSNVADALNEIPSFGNPDADPQGTQNGNNVGQNFVDFLGLGSDRTLTLVDGRRFVSQNVPSLGSSNGGASVVDFNVIPIALVERVEVIGIGGAPIYGSDAIAGTINVIMRDRFEGVESTLRHGFTSKGDAEFEQVQLVAGANTSDGKGNVTFSAEWFRQDGLLGTERPRFSEGDRDVFFIETDPQVAEIRRNLRINVFTNGGLIAPVGAGFPFAGDANSEVPIPSFGIGAFPDGNFYQFDTNSNLVPFTPGAVSPGSFFFALGGDGPDFFDEVEQLQSPLDRGVFSGRFNYDLTDSVRLSSDFLFSDSNAIELTNQGGFQTGIFGNGPTDAASEGLVFSADHPFLPQQARDVLADNGIDQFVLSRFNNDIIDSSVNRDQQVFRWTGGFEGDFFIGDRRFNWEAYAVHGESDVSVESEGIIDGRFLNAIDVRRLTEEDLAAVDPADLASIGGQGEVGVGDLVCQSVFEAAQNPNVGQPGGDTGAQGSRLFIDGCLPLNVFGEGVRSDAARAWVTGDQITRAKLKQTVWNANIGGELFDLPAGAIGFNVGFESRRESADFNPDVGSQTSITRASPVEPTGGEFDTDELFFEGVAPIFSEDMNIPGFQSLEINGAVREIDNSQSGSSTVWSAGGNWKPVRDLNIRGNYTESIRSPSVTELFTPQISTFSFADDPCDNRFVNQGPNPDLRRANCVAAGIDPDNFTSNVVNATASGLTGGNPDLDPESAESWSVGFTWEPRWVDNLIIGADHFDIELDDAITALTLTDLLVACFDSADFPNNSACNAFERDADGQIIDFVSGQTNAEFLRVEREDLFVDYGFELAGALGAFSESMAASNLGFFRLQTRISRNRRRQQSVTGEEIVRSSRAFGDPKYQGTFDVTWLRNDTRVFWRTSWQNRARLSPDQDTAFFNEEGEQVTSTSHRFISNVSISQALPRWFDFMPQDTTVQVSVDNVFRRMPNKIEQAAGHFGFAELFGRQYRFTLQARY